MTETGPSSDHDALHEAHHIGDRPSLQGLVASGGDSAALVEALEKAFDYRGDCTIVTTTGRKVTGYIFDRRKGATLEASYVRVMTPDSDTPERVSFAEVDRLEFSGKDAAHGKSFDRWVKNFIEKKLSGQRASIESDPLD